LIILSLLPTSHPLAAGGLPHAGPCGGTTPPQRRACAHSAGRVWAAAGSARRYSRPRACFFLLGLLRCFTSPACPRLASASGDAPHQRAGFPHSGTVGSPPARGLPHALGPSRPPFLGLRHLGHPPGALSNAGHTVAPSAQSTCLVSARPARTQALAGRLDFSLQLLTEPTKKRPARRADCSGSRPALRRTAPQHPAPNEHADDYRLLRGLRPQQKSDGKAALERAPIDLRIPPRPLPRGGAEVMVSLERR
jgi:hypothetical protein